MVEPKVALHVLGLQMSSQAASVQEKLACAEALIRANPGHDLYVLPELSSCGYSDEVLKRLHEVAEDAQEGISRKFFARLARDLSIHIAYGFARRRLPSEPAYNAGRYAISEAVVRPDGDLALVYDEMRICDMGLCSEAAYGFSAGDTPGSFECQGRDGNPVRIGMTICYDLRFPELFRSLALERECDLILHPCAFIRDATFPTYHQFVTTRAQENGVYVLSISYAGEMFGNSIAVPPWVGPVPGLDGQELAARSLDMEENVIPLVVRRDHLEAVHTAFPYRRNINPVLCPTRGAKRAKFTH